jgi:tetratricopeptide (TPR) repeat protein
MNRLNLYTFVLILAMLLQVNVSAAKKDNFPKVGDYLIAQISSQANDYNAANKYYLNLLKKDKKNTDLYLKIIKNNLLNGKIEDANKYYIKLEKIGCSNINIECINFLQSIGPLINGIVYLKNNRGNKALKSFSKISNIKENELYAGLLKAWSLANFYTYKQSIEALDSIKSENYSNEIIMHKALIYDLVNEVELADIFYEQALNKNQEISLINYYLNFLHRNNKNKKKEEFLQKLYADSSYQISINNNILLDARLIENQVNGVGLVLYEASQYLGFEDIDLSLSILNIANYSYPNLHEVDFLSASLLHSLELFDEAMLSYKTIPNNHYLSSLAVIQLANLLSINNQKDAAIKTLLDYLETKTSFKVKMTLGDHYRYQSDWVKAQAIYSQIIENEKYALDPNMWNTFYRRGIAYERNKQMDLAEKDFVEALKLNNNQPDVLNYLGYSWIDSDKNMLKAKNMIELALEQKPDDAYFIDSLAWYYFKVSDFDQANSLLNYASQLAPSDPVINEHYGDTLWKIGKYIEARYQWNRALDLEPGIELTNKIKVKLLKGY